MHLPDALVFFGAGLQRVSGWRTLSAKRRLKSLRVETRPRRKSRIGIRSVGAERRRRNSEREERTLRLEIRPVPPGWWHAPAPKRRPRRRAPIGHQPAPRRRGELCAPPARARPRR